MTTATLNMKHRPMVYRDEQLAYEAAWRMSYAVMLGDHCRFWVVCWADAARLERAGYEMAPGF